MKKVLTVFTMILAITAGTFSTASATDFLVGVKGGYFVWDSYLKRTGSTQFESLEKGDGQLYGPVFSAMFTSDLSLSVSGLFGKQSASWTSEDFRRSETDSAITTGTFSMKINRIDVDSALSYRLTENFKVIAGYKYQYFGFTLESVTFERDTNPAPDEIRGVYNDVTCKMPFHGPAIGIGFSAPISERFFFAANLSALYMWGKFEMDMDGYSYKIDTGVIVKEPAGGPSDDQKSGITMRTRGINFEPTIGASMGEGMPIFTLGVRFQWSQTKFFDGEGIDLDEKWCNDYQYGIFVGIVQPF
jgi:hypothetical protein